MGSFVIAVIGASAIIYLNLLSWCFLCCYHRDSQIRIIYLTGLLYFFILLLCNKYRASADSDLINGAILVTGQGYMFSIFRSTGLIDIGASLISCITFCVPAIPTLIYLDKLHAQDEYALIPLLTWLLTSLVGLIGSTGVLKMRYVQTRAPHQRVIVVVPAVYYYGTNGAAAAPP